MRVTCGFDKRGLAFYVERPKVGGKGFLVEMGGKGELRSRVRPCSEVNPGP